jgi:hypothetical protein
MHPTGFNWILWGHVVVIYLTIGLLLSWIGFMTKHTKNYSRVRNPSWAFEISLIMSWPVLATMEFLRFRKHHEAD